MVRLVIIDNSPTGGMGDVAEAAMPANVRELWVTEPPGNLGYTASVNFAIRTHPKAPWWCIANADTVFAAGDLDRLAASQEELECVPGLPAKIARSIYAQLHKAGRG